MRTPPRGRLLFDGRRARAAARWQSRIRRRPRAVGADSFEHGPADDVALLLHTSGTTSRPKQVPLRQRNLAYSARSIAGCYGLGPDDVSYCSMPLFHVHGLVASTLAALAAGGSVLVPRRYTSRGFWSQAREHAITWVSAGPTTHLMALDARDGDAPREPALRPLLQLAAVARAHGARRGGLRRPRRRGVRHDRGEPSDGVEPASTGAPHSRLGRRLGRRRDLDPRPDGRGRPPGEPGEVAVRGPGVTSGYLNNPEANAGAFVDGWFRTGDRGVLKDGYLYLQGRLKEMILRGGENISPYEIEDVLLAHPAFADAVCFAIEDAKYGEVVGAAVVAEGGGRGGRADRPLPRTPGLVQGPDRDPRSRRDPAHARPGKVQRRRMAAFVTRAPRRPGVGARAAGGVSLRRALSGGGRRSLPGQDRAPSIRELGP